VVSNKSDERYGEQWLTAGAGGAVRDVRKDARDRDDAKLSQRVRLLLSATTSFLTSHQHSFACEQSAPVVLGPPARVHSEACTDSSQAFFHSYPTRPNRLLERSSPNKAPSLSTPLLISPPIVVATDCCGTHTYQQFHTHFGPFNGPNTHIHNVGSPSETSAKQRQEFYTRRQRRLRQRWTARRPETNQWHISRHSPNRRLTRRRPGRTGRDEEEVRSGAGHAQRHVSRLD